MRLDKFLSHTGFGSRKEVKQLLKKKVVKVNDVVKTKGEFSINTEIDRIEVNGEQVGYEKFTYVMLNKPAGYLSATEDRDQKTVIDLVVDDYAHVDLFPVGRLDKDTEGLLMLTNDGNLAHFLLSPKKLVSKTYLAQIDGEMGEADIQAFKEGITLEDGYECLPAELEIKDEQTVLITIREGKFHQVKRMVKARGQEVLYLKRLSMGTLQLDETLKLGEYRPLTENELTDLQQFLPQIEK